MVDAQRRDIDRVLRVYLLGRLMLAKKSRAVVAMASPILKVGS
jgi:hypothetical protein